MDFKQFRSTTIARWWSEPERRINGIADRALQCDTDDCRSGEQQLWFGGSD